MSRVRTIIFLTIGLGFVTIGACTATSEDPASSGNGDASAPEGSAATDSAAKDSAATVVPVNDATADAPADGAVVDAGASDAPADAPRDAVADAPIDAPTDAPADAPADARTDAAPADASIDASPDAGSCPAFAGSAPNAAGAQCHDLANNAPVVTAIADLGIMPVGTGGPIADGLYYVTEVRTYAGSPLAGFSGKLAVVIKDGFSYQVTNITGSPTTLRRTEQTNIDGGADILICSNSGPGSLTNTSYTATCDQIITYDATDKFSTKLTKQ